MAIGSNTLGLLFKIGVDSSTAKEQLQQLEQQLGNLAKQNFDQARTAFGQLGTAIAGAQQKFQALAGDFARTQTLLLTGSNTLANMMGSLATAATGMAGIVLGAFTVVTGAILGTAAAAAKVGAELHDMAQKAGITVETLSTLKVAAELSGTRLETVVSATARLRARMIEAAEGNEKLAKGFEVLGINAKEGLGNLDAALIHIIELYKNAGSEAEAAAVLQAAFGQRIAADLIPVIQQLNKDWDKNIALSKEIGAFWSTEGADAADQFDDALGALEITLKNLVVTMGKTFIPALTVFFLQIRNLITNFKTTIKNDASEIGSALGAMAANALSGNVAGVFAEGFRDLGVKNKAIVDKQLKEIEAASKQFQSIIDKMRDAREKPEKAGKDPAAKQAKETAEDMTAAALEMAQAQRLVTKTQQEAAVANKEINDDYAKGVITFAQASERRLAVLHETIVAEQAALDLREEAVKSDPALQERQRQDELEKIAAEREALRLKEAAAQDEAARATADYYEKIKKQTADYAEFLKKKTDEIVADLARQAQTPPIPIPAQVPGLVLKPLPKPDTSIWTDWKVGATEAIDGVAASFGGLEGIMAGGLQHISGALQNSIQGWILYGKFSGKALKQAAAEAIAGMVAQATVAALFELAAALASLAWGDGAGFTKHMLAAKEYGTVAIVGAIVGGAIGAAGGIMGGGGAAGTASTGGFGGSSAEPTPITVNQGSALTLATSPNAMLIDAINQNTSATQDLHSKITDMTPGNVLAVGADQNPGAIASGTLEAGRRDGGFTREFLSISGLRA